MAAKQVSIDLFGEHVGIGGAVLSKYQIRQTIKSHGTKHVRELGSFFPYDMSPADIILLFDGGGTVTVNIYEEGDH